MNTAHLSVKLHLIPVNTWRSRGRLLQLREGKGGALSVYSGRGGISVHAVWHRFTQGETRWLPRTANLSGDTESTHDFSWIFFNFIYYRGLGEEPETATERLCLDLPSVTFRGFRTILSIQPSIRHCHYSRDVETNSILSVPIFQKAAINSVRDEDI